MQGDVVGEAIALDHGARARRDQRHGLAGGDAPRAGARRHHGEQAGAGADVEHVAALGDAAQRAVVGVVARRVMHHREVPLRHHLAAGEIEIVARLDEAGIDRQRPPIGLDRVLDAPVGLVQRAEVVEGMGVVGLERDRALERGARAGEIAHGVEHDPEVVVILRVARIGRWLAMALAGSRLSTS